MAELFEVSCAKSDRTPGSLPQPVGTGALLGAIGGSVGKGLGIGAVVGGVAGGGTSIYKNHKNYDKIYKNCMRGRGYRVLN